MKEIVNTTYVCEFCGSRKKSAEAAKLCEAMHALLPQNDFVEPVYAVGGVYPERLVVTLPDGTLLSYRLMSVKVAPAKPKGEANGND